MKFLYCRSMTICVVTLLMFLLNCMLVAQWSTNPSINNAICTASSSQSLGSVVNDGTGGVIVTWQDYRNSGDYDDIYAQRINAAGIEQWTLNGIGVYKGYQEQEAPKLVSDGAGGAIIVWQDKRNYPSATSYYNIYAQRINSAGERQWDTNGVVINSQPIYEQNYSIISDGAGGAIISWCDGRNYPEHDIYAQRVNASGVVQWQTDGVAICVATKSQYFPELVSDGSNGAIITWEDRRYSDFGNYDVYAQRINATGVVQWTTDGVPICTDFGDQSFPNLVSDGSGGAIITWTDLRASSLNDIYAQRISAFGTVEWTLDGVPISTAPNGQYWPKIETDGSGGAIIVWNDNQSGISGGTEVYAQRINSSGNVQWIANGVAICTAPYDQILPKLVSDGAEGAIITWEDQRQYQTGSATDIYAQKISGSGAVQWTTNGVTISTAPNGQFAPVIASDDNGGVVIVWNDLRNDNYDIYTQYVDRYGNLGNAAPSISEIIDVINDQGGKVTVKWKRSYQDEFPKTTIKSYYLFRGVTATNSIMDKSIRSVYEFMNDVKNGGMRYFKYPEGTFESGPIYWEFIDTIRAFWQSEYTYTLPTLSDSVPQGFVPTYVMLMARTNYDSVYWISLPDSGYSIDNLPPSPVQSLSANSQAGPTVFLHWKKNTVDPDVAYHEVHRSTDNGFHPSGATKIGQTTDTSLTDESPLTTGVSYYRIITVDVHGNWSVPSSQAQINLSTEVTVPYSVRDKWNMVSVPLTVANYSKSVLYPSAQTDAFAFVGSYVAYPVLGNGYGYWIKFSGNQQVSMTGFNRTTDSVNALQGWNMIGSISQSIATSSVTSIPPGLVTSQFFEYENGYSTSDSIEPGRGYWVKVNQAGTLMLSSLVNSHLSLGKINIVPTNELPPPSPKGDGNYTNNNNSIIPSEFSLEQNYPNPFNPSTIIRYQLPVDSRVTLKVYNVLGEEITTLVDGLQVAGYRFVEWNANNLPSGFYYYTMQSDGFWDSRKFMLMK
ncbi:MAG: T9SS type A sorting domain-containing protein [Ignavibacteriae bacterium]|nr:T9SS type A sorting domain-containing protein [Ignavibacteriota bacterium]